MKYQPQRTTKSIYRFIGWVILLVLIQVTAVPALSQPQQPQPVLPGEVSGESVVLEQTRKMDFVPPANASSMDDFAPAQAVEKNLTASAGQTTQASLSQEQDTLLRFNDDKVGVVVEWDTFTETVDIQFHPRNKVDINRLVEARSEDTVQEESFLEFQIEAIAEKSGQEIEQFDKEVRLVIDLRPYTQGLDTESGEFYLAYRDEQNPNMWHNVPIWVHQEDGLISATVDHFSDWTTGWRPTPWGPSFNEPGVSTFSGAATYQYPIEVPPGRAGLQPSVLLSYSSRGLDGAIHDMGAGSVANGWSLADIRIARDEVEIKDGKLVHPDKFRLVLNGTGYKLQPAGSTTANTVQYHAQDNPSLRIFRYYGTNVPNEEGLYWVVQTPDGTQYRLGYLDQAEEWQRTDLHSENEWDGHKGHHTTDEEIRTSAVAWHVDTVTDLNGNQINYNYHHATSSHYACGDSCGHTLLHWKHKVRLFAISYNFPSRVNLNQDGTIPHGDTLARLVGLESPGTRIEFHDRDGNGSQLSEIQNIYIYHGGDVYNDSPMKEYRIEAHDIGVTSDQNDCHTRTATHGLTSTTRVIDSVREWSGTDRNPLTQEGIDSDTFALPATSFTHTPKPHYFRGGNANQACFTFMYLESVNTGYGGKISFEYTSDGRNVGNFLGHGWNDNWYDYLEFPSIGFNYFVTKITREDGINPAVATTYQYERPCYGQTGNNVGTLPNAIKCHSPGVSEYGNITGFQQTTVTQLDFDGTPLAVSKTEFAQVDNYQGAVPHIGSPVKQQQFEANGTTLLAETTTSYANFGSGATAFHKPREVISTQHQGGNSLSTRVYYQNYDAYGNATHVYNYGDPTISSDDTTIMTRYYHNASALWLVSQVAGERLFGGLHNNYDNTTNLLVETQTFYDYKNSLQAPTKGQVTKIKTGRTGSNLGGGSNGLITSSQLEYDDYGNVDKSTSVTGAVTTINYDGTYHLYPVQTIVNGSGLTPQTTSVQIYGFNGSLDGFQRQRGLLKQVSDPNGVTVKYEYDPFGRLYAAYDGYDNFAGFGNTNKDDGDPLQRILYWDNSWNHTVTYLDPGDDLPFLISTYQRPGTWPQPANSSSGFAYNNQVMYDGFGRQIQTRNIWMGIEGHTNTREVYSTTEYNALGQVACQTVPYDVPFYSDRGETWPYGVYDETPCTHNSLDQTLTTYDALGRVRFVTAPDGSTSETRYSINANEGVMLLHQNTINPEQQRTRQSFNSIGQMVLVTDFTGECGEYWGYSCLNGSLDDWEPYTDNWYEYDLQGNLTAVKQYDDSGILLIPDYVEMGYDALGRKTWMDDPDMGRWDYEYDAASNLMRQEDANGQAICFEYDALNRLTRKAIDNTPNDGVCPAALASTGMYHLASYAYDTAAHGIGKLHANSWGPDHSNNKDVFHYDSLGRMVKQDRWLDGHKYTMETTSFDALHRPLTMIYPNGETVTMAYDREGENSLKAGNDWLVNNITYNERGQMKHLDRGTVPNTNPDTWYTYDEAGNTFRLTHIRHGSDNGSDNRPDFSYTYDNVGNILGIMAERGNTADDIQTFGYDHLNRLVSASATGPAPYNHTYTYDELGNFITNAGVSHNYDNWSSQCNNVNIPGYIEPNQEMPHAVKTAGNDYFCYDHNGNMIKRVESGIDYTQAFDVENRLINVNDATDTFVYFGYDASGQRVKTVDLAGKTIYTPFPNYEEEITSSDRLNWHFNEGSGLTAVESTTQFHNGTLQGASWADGISGHALDFDGNNDYVQFEETIDIAGEMTVSAWVRPEQVPTSCGRIVAGTYRYNGGGAAQRGWSLGVTCGTYNEMRFRLHGEDGTLAHANAYNFFTDYENQWVHITGVYKPGESVALYINGALVAEDTTNIPTSIGQSGLFKIGARADNTTQGHWDGQIDEVQIVAQALSAAEVVDLAQEYTPPVPAAPTNLTASDVSIVSGKEEQSYIWLRWIHTAEPGTIFNVYRSQNQPVPVDAAHLIASGLPTTAYSDANGTTMDFYVVTAVNWHGESDPSNSATVNGCSISCSQTLLQSDTAVASSNSPETKSLSRPSFLPTNNSVNPGAIVRVTYSLAGQAIAVRVSGDPVAGNNGLYYIHNDHLGSTAVLTDYSNGYVVGNSQTYYLPFGDYRGAAPTQTVTDRDFTGQKENRELGLLYYNARYYVPGIGRFASADTIVPDPANPQSYNRFSYVRNNPLGFTDPSGHSECGVGQYHCEGDNPQLDQLNYECRYGCHEINDLNAFKNFDIALKEHIDRKNEFFNKVDAIATDAGIAGGGAIGFFSGGGPPGAFAGAFLGGLVGSQIDDFIFELTGDTQIRDDLVNFRNGLEADFNINEDDGTFSVYVENEGYQTINNISFKKGKNFETGNYSVKFMVALDSGDVVVKHYDIENYLTYSIVIEDLMKNQDSGYVPID